MKTFSLLLLVILLSACQNASIADLVTRPGDVLFRDDFSNPANGWPQSTSSNGVLGYAANRYQMLVQSANYDLRAVSGHAYGDVQIEVDTTWLAGPLDNRFGLICRFQDMDHYYFFIISSDGYYAIGKFRDGTASLLGQEMMEFSSAIQAGEEGNQIRFDCIGNSLTGFVNNQPIALTQDADYSAGDAGLITGTFDETGVLIGFENFVVIKP
jgi:hypothetical protein